RSGLRRARASGRLRRARGGAASASSSAASRSTPSATPRGRSRCGPRAASPSPPGRQERAMGETTPARRAGPSGAPPPARGGGEARGMARARELARLGPRSTIAADPRGRLAERAAAAGIAVVPLRIANHADVRAALALRRLARGHDVVHFHTARAHALAPFVRRQAVRLVVTRRMDYVPAGGPYARFLYNRAVDVVIA